MANFRLYRLDGAGKIASAEWLAADDDEHALEMARGLNESTTVEIWNRNRFVGRVQPEAEDS